MKNKSEVQLTDFKVKEYVSVIGWSKDDKYIYIRLTKTYSSSMSIYKMSIKNKKLEHLMDLNTLGRIYISQDEKFFIIHYNLLNAVAAIIPANIAKNIHIIP